jgi:hypothetical protein
MHSNKNAALQHETYAHDDEIVIRPHETGSRPGRYIHPGTYVSSSLSDLRTHYEQVGEFLRQGHIQRTEFAEHGRILKDNFAKPLSPTGC